MRKAITAEQEITYTLNSKCPYCKAWNNCEDDKSWEFGDIVVCSFCEQQYTIETIKK